MASTAELRLLGKLKGGEEVHRQWEQGHGSWEEHRMDMGFTRKGKSNRKGFSSCAGHRECQGKLVPHTLLHEQHWQTAGKWIERSLSYSTFVPPLETSP